MPALEPIRELAAGTPVLIRGGLVRVTEELAARFRPGDEVIPLPDGELLLVPAAARMAAAEAVAGASEAFVALQSAPPEAVSAFYDAFAEALESDSAHAAIGAANREDVERAAAAGRSTTRLVLDERMRRGMVEGLRAWRELPPSSGRLVERVQHPGWSVELLQAPLGVVGFVFEGRPNVVADATGVLRGGNTVVFRIGRDALGTARAILQNALQPALAQAGLPPGAVSLIDSPDRAAGWALFGDPRLSLAVARGSGQAVRQLGAVARQAGVPVSLHGTGGAWIVADDSADADRFEAAVYHSLDRKVCNTLNACCIQRRALPELLPRFLSALRRAGERRGSGCRLHVTEGDQQHLPSGWLGVPVTVRRAEGDVEEPVADVIPREALATEWEWEDTPEVSLTVVEDLAEAVELFNRFSPRLAVSLLSERPEEHEHFYRSVQAPFVGDGFTRWVDGQYALGRPELGLSNWQDGRLFARGAVLSGDGVYTVRARARVEDPQTHR